MRARVCVYLPCERPRMYGVSGLYTLTLCVRQCAENNCVLCHACGMAFAVRACVRVTVCAAPTEP